MIFVYTTVTAIFHFVKQECIQSMAIVDQSPSFYRALFRAVENFFGLYRRR
jgi:hypothetical protein